MKDNTVLEDANVRSINKKNSQKNFLREGAPTARACLMRKSLFSHSFQNNSIQY